MDGIPNIDFNLSPSDVVTVPIDDTLSVAGQAADAKATGDALALKADKSELSAAIKVDGQAADAQGEIILLAGHIPMDASANPKTVAQELNALKNRTGADIPVSAESGAPTIARAIEAIDSGVTVSGDIVHTAGDIEDDSSKAVGIEINGTTLPLRDAGAVRSVNGTPGDADGNVSITNIETANNLVANDALSNTGAFVIRSSGGSTSIASGSAWLARLRGRLRHTGAVTESLTGVVNAAPREEGQAPITVAIDAEAFKAAVSDSDIITLSYTTEWSANPELIGVTVSGEPVSGDEIVITYVKGDRGTITPATPTSFRATGWNLYSHANGYARVVKYSDQYGFRIEGAYTSIRYSATLDGPRTSISPAGGNFNVPGDGYVWVTGGNASSTCVYMTWSDWTTGHDGSFEPYTESVIDLTTLMATTFPDGLLAVGAVADEIDISLQRATVAVEKLAYSEATIAALDAAGRAWEADTDSIYAVLATPRIVPLSIDNVYTVSDHGLELFTGTEVEVDALLLYGQNLRDKLRNDVLTISQQQLTSEQRRQVQENLDVYGKTAAIALVTTYAVIEVDCGTVSSLPKSITKYGITAGSVVVAAQFGTPSAVTWPWHFVTGSDTITISVESDAPSGNTGISGSTTLKLYVQKAL